MSVATHSSVSSRFRIVAAFYFCSLCGGNNPNSMDFFIGYILIFFVSLSNYIL